MKIYVWGTGCGAGDLLDRGLDPREVCGFLDGEGRDGSFLGRPIMAPDALRADAVIGDIYEVAETVRRMISRP